MVLRFRRGHATNSGRSAHRFGSTTRAEPLGRSLPPVVTPPPTTRLPATWTRCSRDSKSPGDSAMPSSHRSRGYGLRAVLRRPEVQEPPGAYEPRDLIHRERRSATLPTSASPHRCRTAAIDRSPLRRSPTGFGVCFGCSQAATRRTGARYRSGRDRTINRINVLLDWRRLLEARLSGTH